MEEWLIGVLGMTATVLSTVSLLPQVVRTWRTLFGQRPFRGLAGGSPDCDAGLDFLWQPDSCASGDRGQHLSLFQCSFLLFMKLQSGRAQVAKSS